VQQHPRKQRAVAVELAETAPEAAKQVAPERQTLTMLAPMSRLRAPTARQVLVVKAVAVAVGLAAVKVVKAVVVDRASPKRAMMVVDVDRVVPASLMAVSPIWATADSRTSRVQVVMAPVSRAGRISPVREAKAPVMAAPTSPAFRVAMAAAVDSHASHVEAKVTQAWTPATMPLSMQATRLDRRKRGSAPFALAS
jgi:hypothetical protein